MKIFQPECLQLSHQRKDLESSLISKGFLRLCAFLVLSVLTIPHGTVWSRPVAPGQGLAQVTPLGSRSPSQQGLAAPCRAGTALGPLCLTQEPQGTGNTFSVMACLGQGILCTSEGRRKKAKSGLKGEHYQDSISRYCPAYEEEEPKAGQN